MTPRCCYIVFWLILIPCCMPTIALAVFVHRPVKAITRHYPDFPQAAFELAQSAYDCAHEQAHRLPFPLSDSPLLTLIDYSQPSNQKRLWVINMDTQHVLFNTFVAHGQGSGTVYQAKKFSNVMRSHASSIGLFLTGTEYRGNNGYSLRLYGLEAGFNDRAFHRHIVVHGGHYATEKFYKKHGYIGRSWGCLAVDTHLVKKLIDTISHGTLVFAYYPVTTWLTRSRFLHCDKALTSSSVTHDFVQRMPLSFAILEGI